MIQNVILCLGISGVLNSEKYLIFKSSSVLMPKWKLADCIMNLAAIFGWDFSCNYNESGLVVVSDSEVFCKCLMEKHGKCVACVL